ncbi:MAG: glycosyltransferase family 2 protein, partial [bacterium]|nr:glycosyltransferase family 2 protein [bacterium]
MSEYLQSLNSDTEPTEKCSEVVPGLVSIIIPVFNTEKYIEKCINSLINQTYSNIEIIVIDNHSVDSSGRRVKEIAKKDHRVRLLENKKTMGVGYSRNRGLDCARGEYIWFVDSDDYAELDFLEKMMAYMEEYQVDIVQCCYREFDNFACYRDYLPYNQNKVYSGRELVIYMSQFVGLCGPNVMLWNKLYKRKVWDNYRFYENVAYEDMHLTYKVLYEQERVLWVSDRLMNWRKTITSNTAKTNYKPSAMHELTAYIDRINYFKEHEDEELVALTLKRLYYTATQHYYLNRKYCGDKGKVLREQSIKFLIRKTWEELKNTHIFGTRTWIRFAWIRLFPMEFGRRSIKHRVDFRI